MWRRSAGPFDARWKSRPLEFLSLPRGDWSYSPALHIREAARWHGIPYHQFRALSIEDQAAYVAHYEIITTLEALDAQAAADRMKA